MTTNPIPAHQTIQNAAEALKRGDKSAARHWAQIAASAAPQSEEPWLILAAVSKPQASVEYLKRALLVNPGSERAMRGLRWAQDRLAKQTVQLPQQKTIPTPAVTQRVRVRPQVAQSAPPKAPGARRIAFPIIIALVLFCAALTWALWPGNAPAALALIRNDNAPGADGPNWSLAEIVKPTYTATSTATTVPTATPTPTSTPLPTEIFTPTALPTDTPGPGPVVGTQPAPVSNGKYILVSISEQHLYAYQDNVLVYSVVASTGMNGSTRVGVFHVLDKIPNAYGATWNIWMPNWMGIYYSGSLENGIHALPILSNGARLWAGYLGTPISFGCVVLGVDEAQWIYDWAEVGTTVEIRY